MGPRAGLDGQKISSPLGFDPRTLQSVASCYTDYGGKKNRYYISERVFVALRYPACNAHAPYCRLLPVRFSSIFHIIS